jgi:hypothetical protein
MIAPTPAPMRVYDGRVALGEIEDHGKGCILAYRLTSAGRILLGRFPYRRAAMQAVSNCKPTPARNAG